MEEGQSARRDNNSAERIQVTDNGNIDTTSMAIKDLRQQRANPENL